MQIDFNKLSTEQIDLIINRFCNKLNNFSTENIDTMSNFIETYRIKRYETGILKVLEGDEILKGAVFGVSKKIVKQVAPVENTLKEDICPKEETNNQAEETIEEKTNDESTENIDLMKQRFSRLNRFRTSSFEQKNSSDETKNNNIVLDDNIEQIESKFSLSEMNSQLPSENLLDRYNFGYINLHDEDDGLDSEDVLGKKTRQNILRIKNRK